MQTDKPCESFGPDRAEDIDALVEASLGHPCPGRTGDRCPLEKPHEKPTPQLRAVS